MGELQQPFGGLSDALAFEKQERGTTREMINVYPVDVLNRQRMSSRDGMVAHASAVLVANSKVHTLLECVYDNPTTIFANANNGSLVRSSPSAGTRDVPNGKRDAFGNYWYIDGPGIVKENLAGVRQYRISLPLADQNGILRAIEIDGDGLIFAAVSAGGDVAKAKIWCYQEIAKKKTELLWEMTPGWFTETIELSEAGMYLAQNDTKEWRSRMALYVGYTVNSPTLVREWDIPYPVNDSDVSPVDGSVFTAHPPNTKRGMSPRSPETTGSTIDWTPRDDPQFATRVRAWHAADDLTGTDTDNSDVDNGSTTLLWQDKTGNERHFYATMSGTDVGPQLVKNAIAGRDALYFDGTTMTMKSAKGLSTDIGYRKFNKNVLPTHKRAQFVWFLALKIPRESQIRTIGGVTQNNISGGYDGERVLLANSVLSGGAHVSSRGQIVLYEEAPAFDRAAVANTANGPLIGANQTPMHGAFDDDGLVLITYVYDGGFDDITGTATLSALRVNGRPVDRWASFGTLESLMETCLGGYVYPNGATSHTTVGQPRFRGLMLESIVVEDSRDVGYAATTGLTQNRLMTMPIYPDSVWGFPSDTDLERYEGYIANKWGMAHKLPAGHYGELEATAVIIAGNTVTIDGNTYTFVAALAAAYDVLVGANNTETLRNLHDAINGTGAKGTAYHSGTITHPTFWSPGVFFEGGATPRPTLMVQDREARRTTAGALAVTGATLAWNGAAAVTSLNGAGRNHGHYPHPYFLYRVANNTIGGPPNPTSNTTASQAGGLISQYGMTCKWEPTNGKLARVLTTNGPGATALPVGGVGWGVRVLPSGHIVTMGPRQATVVSIGVPAPEDIDVRKTADTPTGWDLQYGTTALKSWGAAPGINTYEYPRMDVDKYGNVYCPLFQAAANKSLAVYRELAPTNLVNSAELVTVTDLLAPTSDPQAMAVAIDREYPAFPSSFNSSLASLVPRAERVLLFTRKEGSDTNAIWDVQLVTSTATNVEPQVLARAAGVGASLYTIAKGAAPTLISSSAFDSSSRFVSWCESFGRVFITDGTSTPKMWDPRNGTFGFWRAAEGAIPKRPLLLAAYRNRVWAGPLADEPHVLTASAYGTPFGWDFEPKGDAAIPLAAWRTNVSDTTGDVPDRVTCLTPKEDDLMVVGCASNLFLMRGDPMGGGEFDLKVRGVGMAFGRTGCFTPDGTFWFISDQAELRAWTLQGPTYTVSRDIERRLSNAIDFSVCRPEICYDPRRRRLHIRLFPYGVGDTAFTHFIYVLDTKAFVEVKHGGTGVQPTSMLVGRGAALSSRVVLYGCRDGWTREESPTAATDDGTAFDWSYVIAPLSDQGDAREWVHSDFEIKLGGEGTGARIEFLQADNPESLGTALEVQNLYPGLNTLSTILSGSYTGLRIKNAVTPSRASIERITVESVPASTTQRVRTP